MANLKDFYDINGSIFIFSPLNTWLMTIIETYHANSTLLATKIWIIQAPCYSRWNAYIAVQGPSKYQVLSSWHTYDINCEILKAVSIYIYIISWNTEGWPV